MTLHCLRRFCWPCQFWTRWRMCIMIIIASQSVLLLLFSDVIQRKSPRLVGFTHNLNATLISRTFHKGNSSIRAEIRNGVNEKDSISRLLRFNSSNLLKFAFPERKTQLKYEVPEAKLKKINVVQLKQTLEFLSKKADTSIIDPKQQSQYGTQQKSDSLKDDISRMQSARDKDRGSKNDNINGRNSRVITEQRQAGIDRTGEDYGTTKDSVDKVRPSQYNSSYIKDKERSYMDSEQHSTNKLPSKTGMNKNKMDGNSHNMKATISNENKLSLKNALMPESSQQVQNKNIEDGLHSERFIGPQLMTKGSTVVIKGSTEGQTNPGSNKVSAGAIEGKASNANPRLNSKVDAHKFATGLDATFNRSIDAGPNTLPGADPTARINPNRVKVTTNAYHQSTFKKLPKGLKHPINSPISSNKASKALIYHGLHIANNISRLTPYSSDIQPNVTLSEGLVYDFPPYVSVPSYFRLKDESTERHFDLSGKRCYIEGTEPNPSNNTKSKHCNCKLGYYGHHCSIPDFVYFTVGSHYVQNITPRNKTRRIINAMTYNMEHELLEARINELWDVVDVFLILESNYSYHGDIKPLKLWESLRSGYLKEFHSKILYIFLDHFPEKGRNDGWLADRYPRQYIGQVGLRHVIRTRPDDLFIYTDTDEIPSKDALLFLRLHDGYPEPFGFTLRWSVYGFFWQQYEPTRVWAGCTLAMLRLVFNWDVYSLRSGNYGTLHQASVATYIRAGGQVYEWYLGGVTTSDGMQQYTGWHCSWCLPPDRIRTKLTSAINADFPRWGDFPEKLDLDYIRGLIQTGTWFDDVTKIGDLTNADDDDFYAPTYILRHPDQFKALLDLNEASKNIN